MIIGSQDVVECKTQEEMIDTLILQLKLAEMTMLENSPMSEEDKKDFENGILDRVAARRMLAKSLRGKPARVKLPSDLLEDIAALEHKQWAHWAEYLMANFTRNNVDRWKYQIRTSYYDLTNDEQEKDRKWGRKVLELVERALNGESLPEDKAEPQKPARKTRVVKDKK